MRTQEHTIDWEAELPLHREWMVQIARSRLGDLHGSEDVVQDVILSAVRQNPRLDSFTNLRGWLYQAVVRRIADHLRTRYRQTRVIDELAERETEPVSETGWSWLLVEEQCDSLAVAIKKLSQQDRELVMLKFTQNWSYRQLGERFGIAERAIEYRLVRAKLQLRAELQKLCGDDHE
ncbi:MAG: RNA polymerase sigma factor [Rubripirellula sp.]|nr:RNA polymerase sigma factor [Rubripirellula sp.]